MPLDVQWWLANLIRRHNHKSTTEKCSVQFGWRIWCSRALIAENLSGLKFKVSLHCMKCNFFRSFKSVYQKCCHADRETVVLQLVNSFCKPHLLYATECLQLSHTAIKKLKSAWFCALSKIFHVKGSDVDFISELCERYCFETEVANRQDRFCRKIALMNSSLLFLLLTPMTSIGFLLSVYNFFVYFVFSIFLYRAAILAK